MQHKCLAFKFIWADQCVISIRPVATLFAFLSGRNLMSPQRLWTTPRWEPAGVRRALFAVIIQETRYTHINFNADPFSTPFAM